MKTLVKEFQSLIAGQAEPAESGIWTVDSGSGTGWHQLAPGSNAFINRMYFDLGGLRMDDATLFFEGATVQDHLNPAVFNQAAGDTITLVDCMSSKPLTDTEATALATTGNFASSAANLTFDQTIYCRVRQYVVDLDTAAWGSMILGSDSQLGSLEASASDRIYCTRVMLAGSPTTANRIDLYPVRYILRAMAIEEPEYEYLMRLKRSYELQNEPDRD
jgi:hypothetical protein